MNVNQQQQKINQLFYWSKVFGGVCLRVCVWPKDYIICVGCEHRKNKHPMVCPSKYSRDFHSDWQIFSLLQAQTSHLRFTFYLNINGKSFFISKKIDFEYDLDS